MVHQSRMAGFALDTACKSGPIDVAVFTIRTPGKFMKSHSGVASTKPAAFSRPPSFFRCETVVTISGQHLAKPETVLSGAGSVKSLAGTQTLAATSFFRSGRGQTCSLLLTSATPSKTSPHPDQK